MTKCKTQVSNPKYHFALAQLFGPSLMGKIADPSHELQIKDLLQQCSMYDVREPWDLLNELSNTYNYLKKFYRCEYIYKNEIANQLLLKFHNDNSATLLKELSSNSCIADIVIVNGQSVAYEIKTELDNFERLKDQIESYTMLYDNVNVVTHSKAIQSLYKILPEKVGILFLDDDGIIKMDRIAGDNAEKFSVIPASYILRQSELMDAYMKIVGPIPTMGTAFIHQYCIDWFQGLDLSTSRKVFSESLKSRRPSNHQFEIMMQMPPFLRSLMLGVNFSKKKCNYIKQKILTLE